jgi:AcrR family transcriptional regulator
MKVNEDAEGVKLRIIAAGRTEFARSGLEAASVRAIGDGAGVTPAMINYYFGGKRGLYDAVVSEAEGRLFERLGAAAAGEHKGEKKDGLAARFAGAYFDFLSEDQELQRLLLREVMDRGEGARALAERYVEPLRHLFEAHFGKREEARQLAVSLFGAVAGYFLYAPMLGPFLGTEPYSPDALARRRRHVVSLATLFEELPR